MFETGEVSMATTMVAPLDRATAERKFYSRMALFMVGIVFLGFAPSFYLRGLVHVPRPNPTLPASVLVHGTLFTLWMLVFVAQTQLVAAGRRDLHKKLGKASFVLALAIIPLMYLVGVWQVTRANQPPFTDPLNWTIVPLLGIPIYAYLLWIGWSRRRESATHKRAMLCAALMMMDPAIGRFPIGPPMLAVLGVTSALALSTYIPLVLHDRRMLGRVHPVTKLAVSLVAGMMVVRIIFLATGSWAPIAAHLPGI